MEPRHLFACPTRGCGPRCPICRRKVGDIHGPHCGPIISEKLGDLTPCTITRADCGPQWATRDARDVTAA